MTVRRSHDRRRRVLYTGGIEPASQTAAERRRAAELRQARRPVAIYGQRVQRRLQARWYSIVPVRNRTYATTSLILLGIATMLIGLHAASVRMDLFRDNEILSNPLRLDRPDSLGRFLQTTLFLYGGGMALLIYQLRRYRLDDYQGTYRLWRTVLVMLLLAAVNSACGLIDWSGAIVDAAAGRRLALSGADWVRMIVTMSLMILAVRVLVDVRRNRVACGVFVAAGLIVLIPESVRWNLTSIEDLTRWTLVTSAPLLATVGLVIGLSGYLRTLYREVQEIEEGPSLGQRIRQIGWSVIPGRDADGSIVNDEGMNQGGKESAHETKSQGKADDSTADTPDERPGRRWFGLRRAARADNQTDAEQDSDGEEAPKKEETVGAKKPTGHRGLRQRKKTAESKPAKSPPIELNTDDQPDAEETDSSPKRASLWSRMKRKKPASTDTPRDTAEPNEPRAPATGSTGSTGSTETDSDGEEPQAKQNRFGLGRFLKKRATPDEEIGAEEPVADDIEPEQTANGNPTPNPVEKPTDHGDYVDPESIDWASLSKSERRRLKKVIKRQGRAA